MQIQVILANVLCNSVLSFLKYAALKLQYKACNVTSFEVANLKTPVENFVQRKKTKYIVLKDMIAKRY